MKDANAACPVCGANVPENALGGLCPKCLLAASLAPDEPSAPDLASDAEPHSHGPAGPTIRSFGDYELLEEIAHGGMGVVYKARQVSLNRTVALKILIAGKLASAEEIGRFCAEAQAAAHLDHPSIVPIYEVGVHEGQHYFTMRLVEGDTLAARMAEVQLSASDLSAKETTRHQNSRGGARSKAQSRKSQIGRLMAKVARAVHYAHQRRILHRDLKPGNILLDQQGEPFVTDFGLAKALESGGDITRTAVLLGTPGYMSPEQAQARPLTTSSDVFSLGAILYEMLTGRTPFQGATVMETLRKLIEEEPARLCSMVSEIDVDLETICLRCLEKDPARRYGSADALADDLERWLAGEPIQSRRTTVWERAVKWSRRKPALAALAATSAVAVLALSGIAISVPAYQKTDRARLEAESQRFQIQQALALAEEARRETELALAETEAARRETEIALAKVQAAHYARDIAWSEREWLANNVARAEQLLDGIAPELRRWEWHYLRSLCHSHLFSSTAHAGAVRRLALTADGRRLGSIHSDGTFKMWDAETGEQVPSLPLEVTRLSALAFSPHGGYGALGTTSGTVLLWDMVAGRVIWSQTQTTEVTALAFSPDEMLVASGGKDSTVKVWSVEEGKLFAHLKGHSQRINTVAFHPEGKLLASASGDAQMRSLVTSGAVTVNKPGAASEIRIWDLHSGDLMLEFGQGSPVIHSIAYNPNGDQIASAHGDGTILLWKAGLGTVDRTLPGHGKEPFSVRFNAKGNQIVSANADGAVRVWDVTTGEQMAIYRGHHQATYDAMFDLNGSRIYSASADGTIKVWPATRNQRLHRVPQHTNRISGAGFTFSPDGKHALTSRGVWDLTTRQLLMEFERRGSNLMLGAFNAQDGRYIALSSGDIYKVPTGRRIHQIVQRGGFHYDVGVSPDGQFVAYADRLTKHINSGSEIGIWDTQTKTQLKTLPPVNNGVWDLAFSPDGRWLAAALGSYRGNGMGAHDSGVPGEVRVWDWRSGKLIHTFSAQRFALWRVAFSPDGKILAAGGGLYRAVQLAPGQVALHAGEVLAWELETRRKLLGARELPECVFSLAFSPDGSRLVSAGGDWTFPREATEPKLWDLASGMEVFALHGARSTVESVAFSPDGKTIAAGCRDGNIIFWSIE